MSNWHNPELSENGDSIMECMDLGESVGDYLLYYIHWCGKTWHTVDSVIPWAGDPGLYKSGGGTLSTSKHGLICCS